MMTNPSYLPRPSGEKVAYRQQDGSGPGVIWLGGYASDMLGTKAEAISTWAKEKGRAYTRFDYTGHGESDGDFDQGGLTQWSADALAVLDEVTEGPQILVGSSMGGWVASLLAKKRPERLAGIIYIAPAPDFTEELMWPSWTKEQQETVLREGKISFPSPYDDSVMSYSRALYEQGKENLVFSQPLKINVPVRILQGMNDDSVPWQHAMRLAEHIEADDLQIHITKKSDHRMSSDEDLATMLHVLEQF